MQTHASIGIDCKKDVVVVCRECELKSILASADRRRRLKSAFAAVVSLPFKSFFNENFATPYASLYSWSGMEPVLKLRLLQ